MKEISKILNKKSNKDLALLGKLINAEKSALKNISKELLTFTTINYLLSKLSSESLSLLESVYSSPEGITFGTLEKSLNIELSFIEEISNDLSLKLLIHRIKNRQLLTKKMDKIYPITEISKIIKMETQSD